MVLVGDVRHFAAMVLKGQRSLGRSGAVLVSYASGGMGWALASHRRQIIYSFGMGEQLLAVAQDVAVDTRH